MLRLSKNMMHSFHSFLLAMIYNIVNKKSEILPYSCYFTKLWDFLTISDLQLAVCMEHSYETAFPLSFIFTSLFSLSSAFLSFSVSLPLSRKRL